MRRRANRILMAIVLILLCLVLMTTSVVSGIFAKYTVQKHVSLVLGFESFGIKVEVLVRDDIKQIVGSGYQDNSGHITVENLWLRPGDSYEDAVTFKVTGRPTTAAKVTVCAIVEQLSEKFAIDHNSFPSLCAEGESKIYIPMTFYVGNNGVVEPYSNHADGATAATTLGTNIESKIQSEYSFAPADDGGVYKTLAAKTDVDETYNFGFGWKKGANVNATDCYDEIGTWISDKQPKFTVTYEITVEQI